MGKELVISADRHETRVAVLEDDQLVEIYFQRANEYSLAGSIHKGRVTRVLPGMQSAFVDIGLERDAFLYVSDFFEEHEEYDKMPGGEERSRRGDRDRDRDRERGQRERERPEPAPAPAAAAAEAPVVERTEPPAERADDDRDRRGRRSRRRRNRGHGFPESKYAAEPGTAWVAPEREEVRSQEPSELPVLPGESLAKYRPRSADGAGEAKPAHEAAEPVAVEWEPASIEPPAEAQPEPQAVLEETATRLPSAPEPAEPAEPGETEAPAIAAWIEEAADAEEEGAAVESPEAETEAEAEPEGTSGLLEEQPQEQAAEQTAAPSAELRERGPRYAHRISRRMRRKTRTGAEPKTEAEPAVETAKPTPAPEAARSEKPAPSISDLLSEGQEILVQIAKEPLGQKGARITSHIALPGRYCVYMPTVDHLGVSRKINSDEERMRLRRVLQTHRTGMPGGFIVRTAGTGRSEQEIAADMMYLYNLWLDIRQRAERKPAPVLAYHDLDLVQRLLRDQLTDNFKAIWVDNEEVYESILRYVERLQPAMVSKVKMYTRSAPIFDAFNITAELEKALRPKVWLKSGGYIVVNQTEALVAIDINTGKYVGKSARLEDTIVKTNVEAIKEISRQVRLRDLGGIIVIDFIDMDERKNRQKVMQALEDEMRNDRAPYKILQFNDFGLVAITRKRVKQSLERTLCAPCPTCEGSGYVKSVQTVIGEILQEAHKIAGLVEGPNVALRVNPDVAKVLKSTNNDYLEEMEEILKRPVLIASDPILHPEKFDLA